MRPLGLVGICAFDTSSMSAVLLLAFRGFLFKTFLSLLASSLLPLLLMRGFGRFYLLR